MKFSQEDSFASLGIKVYFSCHSRLFSSPPCHIATFCHGPSRLVQTRKVYPLCQAETHKGVTYLRQFQTVTVSVWCLILIYFLLISRGASKVSLLAFKIGQLI